MSSLKVYFDNNIIADLAEDRNGNIKLLAPLQQAISDGKIIVVPSLELVEEIISLAKVDVSIYQKRWDLLHQLVSWDHMLKQASDILRDDIICFVKNGHPDNPYITHQTPYYGIIERMKQMTEPPMGSDIEQLCAEIHTSKGAFRDVIMSAGKDWHSKVELPADFTFLQYWAESRANEVNLSTSFPYIMLNKLAKSIGVDFSNNDDGLVKLLEQPTILCPIGYWAHSWFEQVTKGRKEKPSVTHDFRHCTLAAAVGTFVTRDAQLFQAMREIAGYRVSTMSLSALISNVNVHKDMRESMKSDPVMWEVHLNSDVVSSMSPGELYNKCDLFLDEGTRRLAENPILSDQEHDELIDILSAAAEARNIDSTAIYKFKAFRLYDHNGGERTIKSDFGQRFNGAMEVIDPLMAKLDNEISELDQKKNEAKHSADFRSVIWFGKDYSFTPTQAACVSILWKAWVNGTPDVGEETLLEKSGSESNRLVDIFKHNDAWKVMIVPGSSKGTKRLSPPTQ